MQRVIILGCSGSGKSTVARKIGTAANLPVVHLDQHYFYPGWVEKSEAEWDQTVSDLCSEDRWVMDGNYSKTLDARLASADTAIFIDYPPLLCLFRVLKRMFTQYGQVRIDAAVGCPERFDLGFIGYVLNYHRARKPSIVRKLREHSIQHGNRFEFVEIKSDYDILVLLSELKRSHEQTKI